MKGLLKTQLKLSGATAHEAQGLLCPSQNTGPLGAEVHEQTSQSGDQSEARPQCLSPQTSSLSIGTNLSTHCSRDDRLSRPCPSRE
ncbi:hypothetical protein TNCV_3851561 [Trichonephila clavipes]|nr:hypothetical protein TNCV_3851561 [Trichonephila clavipes]